MKIGVITNCFKKSHAEGIELAATLGITGVQIYATKGDFSPETLSEEDKAYYKKLLSDKGLVVSALCADMGGYGFEREEDNPERIRKTNRIVDLAVEFGTNIITTHIGVIPDDKTNPRYKVMLEALTECGLYAKEKGVTLAIETGPEKAKTLLAFLEDTKGGVGVNLDPANFTMVTGQDAVEAVYILKDYIVHTHAKDGIMLDKNQNPTDVYHAFAVGGVDALNACKGFKEVPLGEGEVDWDAYLAALCDIGYDGFLTIERETGADPSGDIKLAVEFLKKRTVKKVGFIDYYLNEWHADNYPNWIRKYSGGEFEVAYAYGEIDPPIAGRISNKEWAQKHGIELLSTIDEIVEKSDVIVVLSPDNSERHYDLSKKALESGKPVYIDKTFADSKEEALKIFAVAEKHGTPCYSSSALRFSTVVNSVDKDGITTVTSYGAGSPNNYLVHLVEPISMLMGTDIGKVMCTASSNCYTWTLCYKDGRKAYCNIFGREKCFNTRIVYSNKVETVIINDAFFDRFIEALVKFFKTSEAPVSHTETVEIMGIIELCKKAYANQEEWIEK